LEVVLIQRNKVQGATEADDCIESELPMNITEPYGTYHDPDIPNDIDGFGKRVSPSLRWPLMPVSHPNLEKGQSNEKQSNDGV
jgi:hypothetical protein